MPINAAALAEARRVANLELTGSATIQRKTAGARDAQGRRTATWADVATIAVRRAPAGYAPAERLIAGRLSSAAAWVFTFPALTDVRADDRIVMDGITYEVAGIAGPRTDEITRRVVALQVT